MQTKCTSTGHLRWSMMNVFKSRNKTTCHKAPVELSSQVPKQKYHPASHNSNRRLISLKKTTVTSGHRCQCAQITIVIEYLCMHAIIYYFSYILESIRLAKQKKNLNMANKSILSPQKSVLISSEASSWLFHNFLNFWLTRMSLPNCHHLFLTGWLKTNTNYKHDSETATK